MIDNTEVVASLIDEEVDGDTFWYTELLDRRNNKGNNGFRLLRTFEHNSRAHFLEQVPDIKSLCDAAGVRAYTRLTPRSRAIVAKQMAQDVLKQVLEGRYAGVRSAYASACGRTNIHGRRLWLYDVDTFDYHDLARELNHREVLIVTIRSKSGWHLVCKPHHVDYSTEHSLHKDNPTNLYIPDSAK